ncbi:unnamed protein product [Amoebophrya sp. A120]|nr:unnamed protein product [Amoebophrya sp. A120]|eukprot:GSA120T00021814001.1
MHLFSNRLSLSSVGRRRSRTRRSSEPGAFTARLLDDDEQRNQGAGNTRAPGIPVPVPSSGKNSATTTAIRIDEEANIKAHSQDEQVLGIKQDAFLSDFLELGTAQQENLQPPQQREDELGTIVEGRATTVAVEDGHQGGSCTRRTSSACPTAGTGPGSSSAAPVTPGDHSPLDHVDVDGAASANTRDKTKEAVGRWSSIISNFRATKNSNTWTSSRNHGSNIFSTGSKRSYKDSNLSSIFDGSSTSSRIGLPDIFQNFCSDSNPPAFGEDGTAADRRESANDGPGTSSNNRNTMTNTTSCAKELRQDHQLQERLNRKSRMLLRDNFFKFKLPKGDSATSITSSTWSSCDGQRRSTAVNAASIAGARRTTILEETSNKGLVKQRRLEWLGNSFSSSSAATAGTTNVLSYDSTSSSSKNRSVIIKNPKSLESDRFSFLKNLSKKQEQFLGPNPRIQAELERIKQERRKVAKRAAFGPSHVQAIPKTFLQYYEDLGLCELTSSSGGDDEESDEEDARSGKTNTSTISSGGSSSSSSGVSISCRAGEGKKSEGLEDAMVDPDEQQRMLQVESGTRSSTARPDNCTGSTLTSTDEKGVDTALVERCATASHKLDLRSSGIGQRGHSSGPAGSTCTASRVDVLKSSNDCDETKAAAVPYEDAVDYTSSCNTGALMTSSIAAASKTDSRAPNEEPASRMKIGSKKKKSTSTRRKNEESPATRQFRRQEALKQKQLQQAKRNKKRVSLYNFLSSLEQQQQNTSEKAKAETGSFAAFPSSTSKNISGRSSGGGTSTSGRSTSFAATTAEEQEKRGIQDLLQHQDQNKKSLSAASSAGPRPVVSTGGVASVEERWAKASAKLDTNYSNMTDVFDFLAIKNVLKRMKGNESRSASPVLTKRRKYFRRLRKAEKLLMRSIQRDCFVTTSNSTCSTSGSSSSTTNYAASGAAAHHLRKTTATCGTGSSSSGNLMSQNEIKSHASSTTSSSSRTVLTTAKCTGVAAGISDASRDEVDLMVATSVNSDEQQELREKQKPEGRPPRQCGSSIKTSSGLQLDEASTADGSTHHEEGRGTAAATVHVEDVEDQNHATSAARASARVSRRTWGRRSMSCD